MKLVFTHKCIDCADKTVDYPRTLWFLTGMIIGMMIIYLGVMLLR